MKHLFAYIFVTTLFWSLSIIVFAEEVNSSPNEMFVSLEKVKLLQNNREVFLKDPSIIYNDQRYIPLREVMEITGRRVVWYPKSKSIRIKNTFNSNSSSASSVKKSEQSNNLLTFNTDIHSKGGIVIEDEMDQIMYEKNSYKKFYPASTVKIMTALLALENGKLTDEVVVSKDVNEIPYDSSRSYIQPGDRMTLEQLLHAMLIPSGNDAAVAIGAHVAGSEEAFVKMMNERIRELGGENTHFVNAHGYHHPDQYTTPYDLALITNEAAKIPEFLEVIQKKSYKAVYKNKDGKTVTRYWSTTNQLLKNDSFKLDGVVGGKTGFTNAAQHTLVTIAKQNNHRYISVVLKGSYYDKFSDSIKLLKKAYQTRQKFTDRTEKKIIPTYVINKIYVNGELVQHEGEYFLYNGTTYISESYLNKILAKKNRTITNNPFLKNRGLDSYVFSPLKRSLEYLAQQNVGESPIINRPFAKVYNHLRLFSNFYFNDNLKLYQDKSILFTAADQYLKFDPSIKL